MESETQKAQEKQEVQPHQQQIAANPAEGLLDFEASIAEIESKIDAVRNLTDTKELNVADEVNRLQTKLEKHLKAVYSSLSPWQKVQLARHPNRPHFGDYIKGMFTDFTPLAGDKTFAEDAAILGGLARFNGRSVMVIGHEKGKDIASRLSHNFGMATPDGYRKSKRLMELADKFHLPVITLVDTAGAYPGVDAEQRGQGRALSEVIDTALSLKVPVISAIVGEGGSGGAIALATANKILMLEYSIYSVISPEGCASILWKDKSKAMMAADSLKLTAQDLLSFGIIDEIVPEPLGAAHRNYAETMRNLSSAIQDSLTEMKDFSPERVKALRHEKFMKMTIIY